MKSTQKSLIWFIVCPLGGALIWIILGVVLPHNNLALQNIAGAVIMVLTVAIAFLAQIWVNKDEDKPKKQ